MSAPYRMVTRLAALDGERAVARWRPAGGELGPADPRPAAVPPALVLEAAAQCAGLLLAGGERTPGVAWMLAGVDGADLHEARWDEEVVIEARVVGRDARAGRVLVDGAAASGPVCHARLLMVRRELPETP